MSKLTQNENAKNALSHYGKLSGAESIEDGLCLAVLIAKGILPYNATIQEAKDYYNNLPSGCDTCPFAFVCLACIINE